MIFMKNITLIATLRKKKGLTQEALAERCGISVRTIQRLESGADVNLATLNLVAQNLDVKIGDLFESTGNQDKDRFISDYSKNQATQVYQRQNAHKLYTLSIYVFILIMLCVTPFIGSFGILWAFMWPIGLTALKAVNIIWIEPKLDQKYPLTKGINIKKFTKSL